jgi:hypothetical protein
MLVVTIHAAVTILSPFCDRLHGATAGLGQWDLASIRHGMVARGGGAGRADVFAMILLGGGAHGNFNPYAGGLSWQSAAYCTWESLFCVGTCLGLLTWFRERFNRQEALARFLSDNAFAVYVFHAPILAGWRWPCGAGTPPPSISFLL